jgi:hypothetical protein
MDNNFYEQKRERKRLDKKQGNNPLTMVIVIQLVMSLLLTAILYGVCSTESQLSQNIKNIYSEICETDIAVSGLFDTFKNVVKQTFSPSAQINETEDKSEVISGEEVSLSPDFIFGELI